MEHVLVTGGGGFVGQHLTKVLVEAGYKVSGVSREPAAPDAISSLITSWHSCDLTNKESVFELDLSGYDAVICLAGLAAVGPSYDKPDLYERINVAVLSNLCERLVDQKLNPRIVAISSGAVYDNNQPMPLTENSKLGGEKTSPYALSKIAMEKSLENFRDKGLTNFVVARPFNHIGPGQGEGFLIPDKYRDITEAIKNGTDVKTSSLASRRDFTDVRDVVKAYVLLAEGSQQGVYNVCSGKTHSAQEAVDELVKIIPGAENVKFVSSAATQQGPDELLGSYERLHKDTGWQPTIPFEQSIRDFVASKL